MPERRAALFAAPLPERGAVLAFDFGLKRTGVAIGELGLGIAHPVTTIDTADRAERMERVARLVDEWRPVLFVVGMPMRDDGAEHALAPSVRKFAGQLHGRFGLTVRYVDETLSSNAAERSLGEAGVHGARRKAALDQVAAQEILQSFFEAPHACA
jgi:putative Holliday junction resolvase